MGGITNFPQGLAGFGLPFVGWADQGVITTGNVFFVNSATGLDQFPGDSQGRSPDRPFKTIAYAIQRCTANNGDVVYVMPGHAETIASGAKINFSVAGVQVIGLGYRFNRPTITFNGTNSIIEVNAASCGMKNIVLQVGVDEVVKAFSVLAAYFTIDAVDVVEVSAKQFVQFVLTSAAGTDLIIQNCVHNQVTGPGSATYWISLVGADRAKILNNWFHVLLAGVSGFIQSVTTAPVNILIAGNHMNGDTGGDTTNVPVSLVANTSGLVVYNDVISSKTAIAGSIALASCYGAQNFSAHTANKSGLLEPVVDT